MRDLSSILAWAAAEWHLSLGAPFDSQSNHSLVRAYGSDGQKYVLKAGRDRAALRREIDALQIFAGVGAVQLVNSDTEQSVLLVDLLETGHPLDSLANDAQETTVAANLMLQLWRPAPKDHAFPTIADVGRAFGRIRRMFPGQLSPVREPLLSDAERILSELLATEGPPMLLHGDLHHGNILSSGAAWAAIDPHGVVGEPGYEVGQFILNPSVQPDHVLAQRLDIFSRELGIEYERLWAWSFVKAMISACWSVEDGDRGWESSVAVAETLKGLVRA